MNVECSPKILFISSFFAPFIQDDLDFFKKKNKVRQCIGAGFFQVLKIITSCFYSDIAFCWFASTYSFIAVITMKVLRKKSIIVIGGVDVAKDDEIGYGIWLVPWKAKLIKFAIKNADKIIALDISLAEKACQLAEYNGENIEIVPMGYDIEFWVISDSNKSKSVITVANVNDKKRLLVKGIDNLIETARLLPRIEFLIIGISKEVVLDYNLPMNVNIIGTIDRDQLLPYYQKAKIYCQPSRHEGMPNVLCEAMLCGCIPVATNVGATKNIIGNIGKITEKSDVQALADAIQYCIEIPEEKKYELRNRIVEKFPKERRESELFRIIKELSF